MGLFSKLAFILKTDKKGNEYLPEAKTSMQVYGDSIKCTTTPYKTIASFDLNIEKPKFDGAVPDATIKFYPLD